MPVHYARDQTLSTAEVIRVFVASGIHRPSDDEARIAAMFANASLVIAAWDGDRLVGVCRALTDFSYCCYVSDLAVEQAYQRQGIGRTLLAKVKEAVGEQVAVLLVASASASDYYPALGFQPLQRGFLLPRQR